MLSQNKHMNHVAYMWNDEICEKVKENFVCTWSSAFVYHLGNPHHWKNGQFIVWNGS